MKVRGSVYYIYSRNLVCEGIEVKAPPAGRRRSGSIGVRFRVRVRDKDRDRVKV